MNIYRACKDGNLNWLKKQKEAGELSTVIDDDAIKWAAANGHLEVIKWLVMESGQQIDVTADNNAAIIWAADNGHLDVIKWIVLESTEISKEAARKFGFESSVQPVSVTSDNNCAIKFAAHNGHFDVVKWLLLDSGQAIDATLDNNYITRLAAEKGRLDIIKWLLLDYPTANKDSVRKINPKFSERIVDVTVADNYVLRNAAHNGHLDIVKWLVLESGQPVDVTVEAELVDKLVAKNLHEVANFITTVIELHKAGITIEQIQAKPGIVEFAEKGLDLQVLIQLSNSDIDELLANTVAEKTNRIRLKI